MSADRVDNTEADEDGGGGDEEYEINSMGEPERTGKGNALRRCAGSGGIATYKEGKPPLPRTARDGDVTMIIEIA